MEIERPDLSTVDPNVRQYIEALEAELEKSGRRSERVERELPPLEPSEPPTTIQIITITGSGIAKRTPRHFYSRQRRGGMGVFDLETGEEDPPAVLVSADQSQSLLVFTNFARAFRIPVNSIPETPVRGRGQLIFNRQSLLPDEKVAAALPDMAKGSVAMVSEKGMVRVLRHHVFGEYMKPGTSMFDTKLFGLLLGACRTPGDEELFIATRQGRAIRFPEKQIPPAGGAGIRLESGDIPVGIASVNQESGVFLLDEDGSGTIRLMSGFNPNKSPGGGGKISMNSDQVIAALTVNPDEDIFIISFLCKIIRFPAEDVPGKEGVVQGVNCMSLRADKATALTMGGV